MPNWKEKMQELIEGFAAEWKCDVSDLVHDPHSVWGELVELGLAEDSEDGFAYVCQMLGAKASY